MRLIISFIGTADLKPFVEKAKPLNGPIIRLLGAIGAFPPGRKVKSHKLLLLNDDPEGETTREKFADELRSLLPQLGYRELEISTCRIDLKGQPTDYDRLFPAVWSALQAFEGQASETIFHLSSGTPAMHTTLVLAAHSFALGDVRLMETSVQNGLVELKPPFFVGVREAAPRPAGGGLNRIPAAARKKLLPGTVIADPTVEESFFRLWKAATGRAVRRTLITGPPGTGKAHAAKQFAVWQEKELVEWVPGTGGGEIYPDEQVLLIRKVEELSDADRLHLRQVLSDNPGLPVAVTSRLRPVDFNPGQRFEGLAAFPCVLELPAIRYRLDIIAIAEQLGKQDGKLVGKLRSRFAWHFRTDSALIGFDDLRNRIREISTLSETPHPETAAYDTILDASSARLDLETGCRRILTMDYEGSGLLEELERIKLAAVSYAVSTSSSQKEAGQRLGLKQQNVSRIIAATQSREGGKS